MIVEYKLPALTYKATLPWGNWINLKIAPNPPRALVCKPIKQAACASQFYIFYIFGSCFRRNLEGLKTENNCTGIRFCYVAKHINN